MIFSLSFKTSPIVALSGHFKPFLYIEIFLFLYKFQSHCHIQYTPPKPPLKRGPDTRSDKELRQSLLVNLHFKRLFKMFRESFVFNEDGVLPGSGWSGSLRDPETSYRQGAALSHPAVQSGGPEQSFKAMKNLSPNGTSALKHSWIYDMDPGRWK